LRDALKRIVREAERPKQVERDALATRLECARRERRANSGAGPKGERHGWRE
jgi:hypothetical protein